MGSSIPIFVSTMTEDLTEVERRLNAFQKEADQLRARRDKLNDQARRHADERDDLNAQVRALVNEANEHKKRRDELNEQVQRSKKLRDDYNKAFEEQQHILEELKRAKLPKGGRSLGFLKRELRRLEFDHQTKVLTPAKEKGLIEEMGRIQQEIRSKERQLDSDPELKASFEAASQAREKAERQHEKVGELAQSAQGEHESMVKLFEQSDGIRKKADGVQEKFVVSKLEADKVHKQYMSIVEQIHAMQEQLGQRRQGAAPGARREDESVSQAKADEIFERFKQGDKLSTEDLMTLQKAGLL
jgi:uncharacterized coiled-coil DUF342 family protein